MGDETNAYNEQDKQNLNMNEPSQPLPGRPQNQSKSIKEQFAAVFRMPGRKKPTEPFPPPFVVCDGNTVFFGEDPVNVKCPKCSEQITTTTETAPGLLAFILGGCLAGSGVGTLGITC